MDFSPEMNEAIYLVRRLFSADVPWVYAPDSIILKGAVARLSRLLDNLDLDPLEVPVGEWHRTELARKIGRETVEKCLVTIDDYLDTYVPRPVVVNHPGGLRPACPPQNHTVVNLPPAPPTEEDEEQGPTWADDPRHSLLDAMEKFVASLREAIERGSN